MSIEQKRIKKVIKGLPKKSRFRFFLFFILISFCFWTSTKLSKKYQLVQPFLVNWIDIPKGVVLNNEHIEINLTLNTSGIEILWYRLFKRELEVSLKEVNFSLPNKLLNFEDQYFNIQKQLFNESELIQISPSVFPLQYSKMSSKWVYIEPQSTIKLRPGYLGEEELRAIPDSVLVYGSKTILDTLTKIQTLEFNASDIYQTIDQNIGLKPLIGLQYNKNHTRLYWTVLQYTEKNFKIPIEVINLPNDVKVKLFPKYVSLRATLPLSFIKVVETSDFFVAVDYNDILKDKPSVLNLELLEKPSSVKKTILQPEVVNYLIRR